MLLLYISGQLVGDINGGSSGIPSLDQYSDQWKDNVESWLSYLFDVPKGIWDTSHKTNLSQAVADNITRALRGVAKDVGVWLLHAAPSVMLIVLMGSILGVMIGLDRAKHYAFVSALAAIILQVVSRYV